MDNLQSQQTITTEQVSSSTGFFNVAYPLQIRWKDSDFPTKATSPIPSFPPTATSFATSPSSTAAEPSPAAINGLSTPMKIAIGVSVPLVLLALILVSFIIICVRRNNGKTEVTQEGVITKELPGAFSEKGPLTATNAVSKVEGPAELAGQVVTLPPSNTNAELPVPPLQVNKAITLEPSTPGAERAELEGGVNASELRGNDVSRTGRGLGVVAGTNRLDWEHYEMPS